MIGVLFEVRPHPQRKADYLQAAAQLAPLLANIDGFLGIERYASLTEPDKILSLSWWRDEAAVRQWRNLDAHRHVQSTGRDSIFADYRLRVASVIRDYGMHDREQAPLDSRQRHDQTETPAASDLDRYLAQYFLTAATCAADCGLSVDELFALVHEKLVPAPSYVVSESSFVQSQVFGKMPASASTDGHYFHPTQRVWVQRAQQAIAAVGHEHARQRLREMFSANFRAALVDIDKKDYRLHRYFADGGSPVDETLRARTDQAWMHFLAGTYGLCVASPTSEAAIAEKEMLQEQLEALSRRRTDGPFSDEQLRAALHLIDRYALAAMPFSPVEYAISSRKRLVDDLRALVRS